VSRGATFDEPVLAVEYTNDRWPDNASTSLSAAIAALGVDRLDLSLHVGNELKHVLARHQLAADRRGLRPQRRSVFVGTHRPGNEPK
jgi:hypothetical protein